MEEVGSVLRTALRVTREDDTHADDDGFHLHGDAHGAMRDVGVGEGVGKMTQREAVARQRGEAALGATERPGMERAKRDDLVSGLSA